MLVLALAGLLWSRALLSFASILIAVPFLVHARQIRINTKQLFAVGLILLPVILSGSWSDNQAYWWNSFSVKIPLVTMLLGLSSVSFTDKQRTGLIGILVILMVIGCGQSIAYYLHHTVSAEDAYLKAKTLPVPADNDHVRFSWLAAITILLGTQALLHEKKKIRIPVQASLLLFLVIYLHILAAKTGLLCLYGGCCLYLIYCIVIEKKWKTGIVIFLVAVFSGWACYQMLPTLRNRIQYILYDYKHYIKGDIPPGFNDGSRLLSIQAGYAITREHWTHGVGFGDMLTFVDQWHTKNHTASLAYERFLPANEWLVYGTGAGLPGVLCFTAGFCFLLFRNTRRDGFSWALSFMTIVPFLTDDTLEGQYGAVILAFIVFFGQTNLHKSDT